MPFFKQLLESVSSRRKWIHNIVSSSFPVTPVVSKAATIALIVTGGIVVIALLAFGSRMTLTNKISTTGWVNECSQLLLLNNVVLFNYIISVKNEATARKWRQHWLPTPLCQQFVESINQFVLNIEKTYIFLLTKTYSVSTSKRQSANKLTLWQPLAHLSHVGRGGAWVEAVVYSTFNRRVAGSTPALAAT